MPGINEITKRNAIKNAGKPYYTKKGNTYMAVPLFDNKGRKHGHVIYIKTNLVDNEKPAYAAYVPLNKFERMDEHTRSVNGGSMQKYIKKGCIALDS